MAGRESKMATGTQRQTVWAPWIRDLAETLEKHLAEVKHQGELKPWHPEPLVCGRLLPPTIYWKNSWVTPAGPPGCCKPANRATTLPDLCHTGLTGCHSTRAPPCRSTRPPPHHVARPLPHRPASLPSHWPARLLLCQATAPQVCQVTVLPSLCPTGPLGCCPLASQATAPPDNHLPAHQASAWQTHQVATQHTCQAAACPPPTIGGLQHHQTLNPNLPRRHRQTGMDAKGVTQEQLRLILLFLNWWFYFFPFLKGLAVLFNVWSSTISPCWFLWFSFFFFFSLSFFFFFLLLSWFC
jgi:hypothetical protein